jgi:hypothetical protein
MRAVRRVSGTPSRADRPSRHATAAKAVSQAPSPFVRAIARYSGNRLAINRDKSANGVPVRSTNKASREAFSSDMMALTIVTTAAKRSATSRSRYLSTVLKMPLRNHAARRQGLRRPAYSANNSPKCSSIVRVGSGLGCVERPYRVQANSTSTSRREPPSAAR